LGIEFLQAVWTNAVREFGLRVFGYVAFNLIPVSLVVSDLFADLFQPILINVRKMLAADFIVTSCEYSLPFYIFWGPFFERG
jgi:hypothetical protein